MHALFLSLVNMSYVAAIVTVVVLVARLLMKGLPRVFTYLLWVLVLFRLVCPVSFESVWGVIPSAELVSPNIIHQETFEITSGILAIDLPINEYLVRGYYEGSTVPVGTTKAVVGGLAAVWLCGVAAMMAFGIAKGLRIRRRASGNVKTGAVCEAAIAFGVLAVHWFNPLVWAAYCVSRRDHRVMQAEAAAWKSGLREKPSGEFWLAGVLVVALLTAFLAGNPLPAEKKLSAGEYQVEMLLYSELPVADPADVSTMPEFCVTQKRDLLVDGQNVGKLIAADWDRFKDQNLVTMSAEGNDYGDRHVNEKELYKTDLLPDGMYYLVAAYEKDKLEVMQVHGTLLWKVYAVEKE